MKRILQIAWKRITKHWITSVKGVAYGVILYMYYKGNITTAEWITATGAILTVNSIFLQKDPGKTANKPDEKMINGEP